MTQWCIPCLIKFLTTSFVTVVGAALAAWQAVDQIWTSRKQFDFRSIMLLIWTLFKKCVRKSFKSLIGSLSNANFSKLCKSWGIWQTQPKFHPLSAEEWQIPNKTSIMETLFKAQWLISHKTYRLEEINIWIPSKIIKINHLIQQGDNLLRRAWPLCFHSSLRWWIHRIWEWALC